jgi:4-diphosphocytidyl-2-C-methyl-D-erythritol kinase
MELHKEIPTQAGLGGASSDAAALLRILQSRSDRTDERRFEQLAREVGADVLFFLKGGTVEATGRGDEFRSMVELDAWALVAVPAYGVETEWAYRQLEKRDLVGEELDQRGESLDAEHWRDLNLTNDFVPLISEEEPLQDRLLSRLREFTDYCSLTGSGSALYGLFETKREGRKAQETLGEEFQDTEFELVTFIGRNDIPKLEREVPCRSQ